MRRTVLVVLLAVAAFQVFPCKAGGADGNWSSSVSPRSFPESLKNVCNQVMLAIHNNILSMKPDIENLADYGQQALSLNQYGIYVIEYQHVIHGGTRDGETLSFGVTIVGSEDKNFYEFGQSAFNFDFPLLNIKFAGYQQTNRKWLKFHIQDVLEKNGDPILREQQKYLPMRLTLQTDKPEYKIGENMEIMVTLKNVSHKNLWVRDLDKDSLYFLYDNVAWGAVEIGTRGGRKRNKFVLEPGQELHKKFIGGGSPVPGEIEMYCSYSLTYEGVKPSSVLKVKVTE